MSAAGLTTRETDFTAHPMLRQAHRNVRFILNHPIGRRRPLYCLSRLVGWQLRSRLTGPTAVPFVAPTRLWARRGETGVTGNIYVGLHEFAEMAFLLHFLRPTDLFGDIGANAGSYTVLASGVIGAKTIAVEPVPETADRLRGNLQLNSIENLVTIEQCAVGSHASKVRFSTDQDTVNHVLEHAHDPDGIEIECQPLDLLFSRTCPALLKIDVEGYEAEALQGSPALLKNPALAALIVELSKDRSVALLTAAGFSACTYDPFTRRLEPTDDLGRFGNVVFVRCMESAMRRLRAAPRLQVMGLDV